ncbi:MAG TPA: NUDIX domain-containing protein [Firmicutes bacterium]|nr:NUDIX domain-containing protein [Bacillota bacterium]
MLTLNLIVRAVIVHDGKLVVTALDDGKRELFRTLLGGHLELGETLTLCVERELREETKLDFVPSRLLYLVENYFLRGSARIHELGFYFLCHPASPVEGPITEAMRPDLAEMISPEVVDPGELASLNFQPAVLGQLIAADFASNFADCPKLVVVNEIPADVPAKPGVYKL